MSYDYSMPHRLGNKLKKLNYVRKNMVKPKKKVNNNDKI